MRKMQKEQVNRTTFVVAEQGAQALCLTPDGEVQWELGMSQGLHRGAELVPLMGVGCSLELSGAVAPVTLSRGRVESQPYGEGATETGANPDFRVTTASRAERELARLVTGLQMKTKHLDGKLAALESVSDMREKAKQNKPEETEVVEKDDPEPKPEPKKEKVKENAKE